MNCKTSRKSKETRELAGIGGLLSVAERNRLDAERIMRQLKPYMIQVLASWLPKPVDSAPPPLLRSRHKMWRYRQQHRICEHCSADQSVHTHHIIPISKGGADDDSNYAALCLLCHADEHPEIKNFILNGDYVPAGLSA